MDKILNIRSCKCSGIFVLLFACFLIWAGLPAYAAGAGEVSVSLPVQQEMTVTQAEDEAVDEAFTYCLTADGEDVPMPQGSEGNVYTFVMNGSETATCGPITYHHGGVYHYTLTQQTEQKEEHYTYDTSVYNVTVYVKNIEDGALTAQIVMENANGEKVNEASFSNSFTGTPKPTPQPPKKPAKIPKTGDPVNITLWYIMLAVSAGIAAILLGLKRKLAKSEKFPEQ